MKHLATLLSIAFLLTCGTTTTQALEVPEGFEAVFNGKDLNGWHAIPHYDHRKLAAMPAAAWS